MPKVGEKFVVPILLQEVKSMALRDKHLDSLDLLVYVVKMESIYTNRGDLDDTVNYLIRSWADRERKPHKFTAHIVLDTLSYHTGDKSWDSYNKYKLSGYP